MRFTQSTTVIKTTCADLAGCAPAALDPACLVSSHRTSQGHVLYYRCYCACLQIRLVGPALGPRSSARDGTQAQLSAG